MGEERRGAADSKRGPKRHMMGGTTGPDIPLSLDTHVELMNFPSGPSRHNRGPQLGPARGPWGAKHKKTGPRRASKRTPDDASLALLRASKRARPSPLSGHSCQACLFSTLGE